MTELLLQPVSLGEMALPNRVVMAPLTRGRAENPDLAPNDLMVDYYRQRAGAGLIISEGTWPNEDAIGFNNVPGIYSSPQAEAWRKVTTAVHKAGGRIMSQLGHLGPMSHPDHLHGRLPFGPSAVNPNDQCYTPTGFKPTVTPRAMTAEDIRQTVNDYRRAAENAKHAGFDGVEIHAAHVYLIPAFLNSYFNRRTDEYGGSHEKRARFLFEIIEAVIDVWGARRVGIKLNPMAASGDFKPNSDTEGQYLYLAQKLNDYPLLYLHLLGDERQDAPAQQTLLSHPWKVFRSLYRGSIIAGGGFDQVSGEATLARNEADLIAYGTKFIANPDLVERFRRGVALAEPNPELFYYGGRSGYTDYPSVTG